METLASVLVVMEKPRSGTNVKLAGADGYITRREELLILGSWPVALSRPQAQFLYVPISNTDNRC